jgi:hypothetical protein
MLFIIGLSLLMGAAKAARKMVPTRPMRKMRSVKGRFWKPCPQALAAIETANQR